MVELSLSFVIRDNGDHVTARLQTTPAGPERARTWSAVAPVPGVRLPSRLPSAVSDRRRDNAQAVDLGVPSGP